MTHPAQKTALELAKLNGISDGTGDRMIDTGYPKKPACYVVSPQIGQAGTVVVYEDDPTTAVSLLAQEGRLQPAPLDQKSES